MACVCILIHGQPNYFYAGRQAALSVLDYSNFNLYLALGRGPDLRLPVSSRIRTDPLVDVPQSHHRATRFLLKFRALQSCLEKVQNDYIILLDADAMFAAPVDVGQLHEALQGHPLGMVEQTTIIGSSMSRADFLQHYARYSLKFIAPHESPPPLENFRYFNSGFVLGTRSEMERLAVWAQGAIANAPKEHQIGEHMIADQDYLQYWTNNLHPACCASLPWYWNHCALWDETFPCGGARIVHFSNFCNGPDAGTVRRMAAFRRKRFRSADFDFWRSSMKRFLLSMSPRKRFLRQLEVQDRKK